MNQIVADPIVVLGVPRSGTSMVAGVFAKHGVWCGSCRAPDHFNAKGHFENLAVKNLMKRWYKGNAYTNAGKIAEPRQGFGSEVTRLLKEDGYRGGRWLFKCAPVYWRLFDAEWDPTWVTVRRDPDAIIESNEDTGFVSTIRDVLPAHLEALDHVEDQKGAVAVDSDAVVEGDWSSMERALASAGIEMDEGIVERFVDPNLWRH